MDLLRSFIQCIIEQLCLIFELACICLRLIRHKAQFTRLYIIHLRLLRIPILISSIKPIDKVRLSPSSNFSISLNFLANFQCKLFNQISKYIQSITINLIILLI